MKQYIISEDNLKRLLKKSAIFNIIKANNIIYSDILKEALDKFGYNTIEDFVDKVLLSQYKEI